MLQAFEDEFFKLFDEAWDNLTKEELDEFVETIKEEINNRCEYLATRREFDKKWMRRQ